jgi:sulfur-oxidizing protein SoxZ
MKLRAQINGDKTTVRVLMRHDMETGQRKDPAGKTIPAWFIQDVVASHNGKVVLSAQWGPSVSKDPFLQFTLKGAKAGDKVSVSWTDNRGDKRADETAVVPTEARPA